MRYHPLIHVTGIALFVLYFLSLFRHVFKLLLEDILPYAFSAEELAATDGDGMANNSEPIPRIIHQVYLGFDNRVMPTSWKKAQQSCIDLHPDYEYMVPMSDLAAAMGGCAKQCAAVDERLIARPAQQRVPMVCRDVGPLPVSHPACRFDPLFYSGPLRWHLRGPGQC